MRLPALLLLLLSITFAASFGYSRLVIERTWNITSDASFEFNGSLVSNDSSQHVLSVTSEPQMEFGPDENGTITLHYAGNGSMLLKASAMVDVDYDPHLSSDSPLPGIALTSTPLTEADAGISAEARALATDNSSLNTIKDIVNWVHDNVEYDLDYWGKEKSARDVFAERRGVCVEYTHLFISMARSLGLQTRYVSGYVFADSWQPHAWAEVYVTGYGWLSVDPTFAQAGVLDNTHLAIKKSDDQSSSYDILLSTDENVAITAEDRLDVKFESADTKGVSVSLAVDIGSYVAEVNVSNSRPEYAFGSYSFITPEGYGGEQSSLLLLKPNEAIRFYHGLNRSLFQYGYFYTVPVSASFNDAKDGVNLSVNGLGLVSESGETQPQKPCAMVLILALIAAAALAVSRP